MVRDAKEFKLALIEAKHELELQIARPTMPADPRRAERRCPARRRAIRAASETAPPMAPAEVGRRAPPGWRTSARPARSTEATYEQRRRDLLGRI